MLRTPDQASLDLIAKAAEASPMTRWLSLGASIEDNALLYRLSFRERHIGNPVIRALHGGVISAFLEAAATCEIKSRIEEPVRIRTISVHTNYLRGAVDKDMVARIAVARLGRRIAFLEATGWQTTEDEPVARAAVALRIFRED